MYAKNPMILSRIRYKFNWYLEENDIKEKEVDVDNKENGKNSENANTDVN